MTTFSFLTSRWRIDLPSGSGAPIPLNGPGDKRHDDLRAGPSFLLSCRRAGIHPRRSRDLIPGTHLLDWGRTNFSISRQLRGCERVARGQKRPSPVTCVGISHRIRHRAPPPTRGVVTIKNGPMKRLSRNFLYHLFLNFAAARHFYARRVCKIL